VKVAHVPGVEVGQGVVVGCKQQCGAVQPPGPHKRFWGCKRKAVGAGQVKVAHVPGVVLGKGVVVGCKQQCGAVHPPGPQRRFCGCKRRVVGAGQEKVAHVPGVVVWCKQHTPGEQPATLHSIIRGCGLKTQEAGQG
jgi:hypothetical protein